jgi:hypothetical protein
VADDMVKWMSIWVGTRRPVPALVGRARAFRHGLMK